jgi:hypothetical protein
MYTYIEGIRHTPDNGFVVIGGKGIYNEGYDGMYLARFSRSHTKLFSGMLTEENSGAVIYGNDLTLTSDGGYVLCGSKDRTLWLRKVNNAGNLNE